MNALLKAASYLFHPLWMPFAGTFIYFLISPRFFPEPVVKAKLMAIAIMTLFIPIVFYFLLKTLNKVQTHFMGEVEERKWPLLFYAVLIVITLKFVLDPFDYPELYYFYVAILASTLIGLILVWFRLKISLHMMGLAGVTLFLIALTAHFNLDLIYTISFFVAITGWTASSRLHLQAHNFLELVLGYLIGLLPQILVLHFWL